MIRVSAFCVTALLLTLAAAPARAAFPGQPGPIAYPKVSTDEVGEGLVESVGGLFAHGPRIKQRPRQLTMDTGDHSPSYSADGRLIVFVHDDRVTATSSIYVMRNDGSERREVTTDGLGGADPAFFPSGQSIAFVRRIEGGTATSSRFASTAAACASSPTVPTTISTRPSLPTEGASPSAATVIQTRGATAATSSRCAPTAAARAS